MEGYEDQGSVGDLEGAGPGGGASLVREHGAEAPPGSRVPLALTLVIALLVLAVPVLWAVGVYTRFTLVPGIDPTIQTVYLMLAVGLLAGAALYFWGQFSESA